MNALEGNLSVKALNDAFCEIEQGAFVGIPWFVTRTDGCVAGDPRANQRYTVRQFTGKRWIERILVERFSRR